VLLFVLTVKYRVPVSQPSQQAVYLRILSIEQKIEYLAQDKLLPQLADSTIQHVLEKYKKHINIRNTWIMKAVLRIRDVYPGSEFFPSRIQDQKDSWIPDPDPDPHQRI
jgi:hypothetical protein